ncbi:MAG: hypothetical protein ABIO94_05085 [Opitutaceae bacterium]
MKKRLCLVLLLTTLVVAPVFSQTAIPNPPVVPPPQPRLTKFDLDFRGGTPVELVAAIEKASGRPLNAIVPIEHAARKLPPLKMKNVNAAELFQALERSSPMRALVQSGNGFQSIQTQYGFRNAGNRLVDDDTVWSFYVEGDVNLPRVTRFYLLTPYLDAGLKVDDITTAIQTGWRMRGDAATPTLSFHKETKLLIAVGDSNGMDVIGDVLKALDGGKAGAIPAPGDKPAEQKKSKQ